MRQLPQQNADQWQAEFAACCWPDCKKDSDKKKTPKIQDFRTVHFGPFRETVWETLEDPGSSLLARFINIFSIILVIISNINLVLGTISYFQTQPDNAPHPVLDHIELVCMVWFTFEYALKIAVSADKTAALFNPMNLVDLTAIMPFYIELFLQTSGLSASFRNINSAMLALKILRSLRICRILKLGKYSGGVQMFARTIINSSSQLMMLSLVIFTGMMFFSTVIYFIEHDEFESQFYSIPAAFWWCVATMSTAGYGDLVPKTIAGKMVAMGAAMCGILVLVIPISIVAENWMEIGEQTEQNQVQEMHEAILARAHSVRRNALVRQKWPKWKRNLLD